MSSDERVPSRRISTALRRDAANQVADPAIVTAPPAVRTDSFRGIWIGASLLAVVIVALAIWLSLRHRSPIPAAKPIGPYLNVDLKAEGDQLQLTSSSNLTGVQRARLDVFDGNSLKQVDVTGPFQAQQAILVPHTTGNVQVILTVDSVSGSLTRKAGFTDAAAILKPEEQIKPEQTKPEQTKLATPVRHKRHRRGR